MINQGSGLLRELIRILVRDLGILEKSDASCSGISLAQCHAGKTGIEVIAAPAA